MPTVLGPFCRADDGQVQTAPRDPAGARNRPDMDEIVRRSELLRNFKRRSVDEWKAQTKLSSSPSDRLDGVMALERWAVDRTMPCRNNDERQRALDEFRPTFLELLHDKDEKIREFSASALCRVGDRSPESIPPLVELLDDPNDRIRSNAAGALGWRGQSAEQAIPALVRVVRTDPSSIVRGVAANALRTTGGKGVDALVELLDDASPDIRLAALKVLYGNYMDVKPGLTPPEVMPKFVKLLGDEKAEIRQQAAQDIVAMQAVPAEIAVQLLHHDDLRVRRIAAGGLLLRPDHQQYEAELQKYVESDFEFCRRSPTALSSLGTAALPILLKLLNDAKPLVRAHAADALGNIGPAAKEAAPALKQLLTDMADVPMNDLDDRVCHHAGQALVSILKDRKFMEGLPPKRPDGK